MDTSNKIRLKRLLDELKWTIESPKIFLFDHFSNLINKIDFAAARQSQNVKNIRNNENLMKINQVWNRMFDVIKAFEMECFESLNEKLLSNSFNEAIESTNEAIKSIEANLKRYKELSSAEIDQIDELLYQEMNRIKKILFRNKSLIFFDRQHQQKDILIFNKMKNNIFFGKLIFVKDQFIGEMGLDYLNNKFYFGTSLTKKFNNDLLKAWFLAKKIKENLTNNSISEMSLENLYKLDSIDLSYQKLSKISKNCFSGLFNLKRLNLADNRLSKIEPGSFDSLVNLNEIQLSNNQLKNIDPNLFKSMNKLKRIDLSKNNFVSIKRDLFLGLENLEFIDMSHNQLKLIDADQFQDLYNLIEIDLSANKLRSIHPFIFRGLVRLQKIWLNYNKLHMDKLELFVEKNVTFISFKRRLFGNDIQSIVQPMLF